MVNSFIDSIKTQLRVFGMDLQTESENRRNKLSGSGAFYDLRLIDRVNHVRYAGFAKEHVEKEAGAFWADVLDNMLPVALDDIRKGEPEGEMMAAENYPAVIILPVEEADTLYEEASKRGAYPSIYRLFDKYSVVAFSVADNMAVRTYMQGKLPDELPTEDPRKEKPKERKKIIFPKPKIKYVAALLLLLSVIAALPLAVKKFKPADIAVPSLPGNDMASLPEGDEYWEVTSPDASDRAAVASNSTIPEEYLRELAQDENERVRAAVAENPALPKDVLDNLSYDISVAVRDGVASNPMITSAVRRRIYPDISVAPCDVREKIYAGESVSLDMLSAAGQGSDTCAKRGVARNSNTPPDIREALMNDNDEWVRAYAENNSPAARSLEIAENAMQNFTDGVEEMVTDTDFLEDLEQAGPAWQVILRQNINNKFRENVYDPVALTIVVLNEERGYENTIDNPESFELFLTDKSIPDDVRAYVERMAKTADNIVSSTMDAVTPYVEGLLADRDSESPENEAPLFSEEFLNAGERQLETLE